MSRTEHIAVVSAGPMGNGIAQVFAAKGHEVIFFDPDTQLLTGSVQKIKANLRFLAENGLGHMDDIDPTIERIRLGKSLKEAVTGARFVVEAVADNLKLNTTSLNIKAKHLLFEEMEQYCSPITILASSAAAFSVTDIAGHSKISERIVGTHFWPPAYLVPLVEVVGGKDTLPEVMEYTCSLLRAVGKHPVQVNMDVPGLVGHRLQQALWRECQAIVEQGIAGPEAVDEIIKKGFGIWLSALGPLENADMFGLDLTHRYQEIPHKYIDRSLDLSAFFQSRLDADESGSGSATGGYSRGETSLEKRWENFFDQLIRWNQKHSPMY